MLLSIPVLIGLAIILLPAKVFFKKTTTIYTIEKVQMKFNEPAYRVFIISNNECSLFVDDRKIEPSYTLRYKDDRILVFKFEEPLQGRHTIASMCQDDVNSVVLQKVDFNNIGEDTCKPYYFTRENVESYIVSHPDADDLLEFFDMSLQGIVLRLNKFNYDTRKLEYNTQIVREDVFYSWLHGIGECGSQSIILHDALCLHGIKNNIVIGGIVRGKSIEYHSFIQLNNGEIVDPSNGMYDIVTSLFKRYTLYPEMMKIPFVVNGLELYSITPFLFTDSSEFEVEASVFKVLND